MHICRYCREEYKEGATKCPHCQSDLRNWFSRHPILSFFLFLFILFFCIFAVISNSTPTTSVESTTPVTTEILVGKHAYNRTNGVYIGVIVNQKECRTVPGMQCYSVDREGASRLIESPVTNVDVKDSAPAE